MRLYARARVEAAEQKEAFVQAAAKAQARSQTRKMVAARKATELVAQAEQTPICVKRLPFEQVQSRAIASSNAFHEELLWERGHDYDPAHIDSDPAFLDRIRGKARISAKIYHRFLFQFCTEENLLVSLTQWLFSGRRRFFSR